MITKSQAKYIQSLSQKKFRNEEKVFVAEGPKIVAELLAEPNVEPVSIFALKEWVDSEQGSGMRVANAETVTLNRKELERVSFLTTPNEVLGVFRQPLFNTELRPLRLMLDGIQDPGNLGTIVRIADWFGIRQVIASPDCADVFNPKVVQATMGSVARVEVRYINLSTFIAEHPGDYFGATLDGAPLINMTRITEGTIVIGNESRGIDPVLLDMIQHKITIPKTGYAESLNAAVATGIILSHLI